MDWADVSLSTWYCAMALSERKRRTFMTSEACRGCLVLPPPLWMDECASLSLSLSLSLSPDNIVPFLPRTLDTDRASHTLIGTYLFCLLSLGRRCGVLSIKGYFKVLDVRFIP